MSTAFGTKPKTPKSFVAAPSTPQDSTSITISVDKTDDVIQGLIANDRIPTIRELNDVSIPLTAIEISSFFYT
jgi:3,4-dihydroxy-2-butanone 4-phosphate synthase